MKSYYLPFILLLPIGAFFYMKSKPKNVRNNNPLNIKESAEWDGERKLNLDKTFEEFKTPEHGFRAGYIILLQYLERGQSTIESIIAGVNDTNGWAGKTVDNNHTGNYIEYVADKMQMSPVEYVSPVMLPEMMLHMSVFEGSQGAFTIEQSIKGVEMAKQADFVVARLYRLGYPVEAIA